MVASTKVAIFLCATLAVSMAAPAGLGLNLGDIVGNLLNPVVGVVNNLTSTVISLLNQILNTVTSEVKDLLPELSKILGIATGQNPLAFVANLIQELNGILSQLLGTVGSAVNDVEGIVSGLPGDLTDIVNQLTKLLNVPAGTNLTDFLENLLDQLNNLIQEILKIVSKLVQQLLAPNGAVDHLLENLLGIISNLQVAALLGNLTGTLSQILGALKGVNV